MRKIWFALAVLVLGTRADADTVVRFKLSSEGPGSSVGGTGLFSFADGLTTVEIGEVKGFEFNAVAFDAVHGGPLYYDYDVVSLKTFSATFKAGPTLAGLSLSTSPYLPPSDPLLPKLAFNVTSLAADGAFMERSGDHAGSYSVGTLTITGIDTGVTVPVPEPSSLVLVAMGIGYSLRKRMRAA